jgi:tetratricopeptide (TPR) repeat protein
MGSVLRRAALGVACVMATCALAHAQADAALARAKTHFEAGRALYSLGNYQDAVREFAAGYELVPKPQFLINLGQCYRRLENFEKAREMYQKYLAGVPANDPERAQVQSLLAEVEREQRVAQQHRRVAIVPAPPLPPPSSGATTVIVARPPERKPFIKRHWWIIPTSIAVAAGIAVGIYFAARPADCPASLGCIRVGQ